MAFDITTAKKFDMSTAKPVKSSPIIDATTKALQPAAQDIAQGISGEEQPTLMGIVDKISKAVIKGNIPGMGMLSTAIGQPANAPQIGGAGLPGQVAGVVGGVSKKLGMPAEQTLGLTKQATIGATKGATLNTANEIYKQALNKEIPKATTVGEKAAFGTGEVMGAAVGLPGKIYKGVDTVLNKAWKVPTFLEGPVNKILEKSPYMAKGMISGLITGTAYAPEEVSFRDYKAQLEERVKQGAQGAVIGAAAGRLLDVYTDIATAKANPKLKTRSTSQLESDTIANAKNNLRRSLSMKQTQYGKQYDSLIEQTKDVRTDALVSYLDDVNELSKFDGALDGKYRSVILTDPVLSRGLKEPGSMQNMSVKEMNEIVKRINNKYQLYGDKASRPAAEAAKMVRDEIKSAIIASLPEEQIPGYVDMQRDYAVYMDQYRSAKRAVASKLFLTDLQKKSTYAPTERALENVFGKDIVELNGVSGTLRTVAAMKAVANFAGTLGLAYAGGRILIDPLKKAIESTGFGGAE